MLLWGTRQVFFVPNQSCIKRIKYRGSDITLGIWLWFGKKGNIFLKGKQHHTFWLLFFISIYKLFFCQYWVFFFLLPFSHFFYTTGTDGSWCMRSALTTQLSFISTQSMIRFFHLKYPFYPGIFKMQNLLFASFWIRHPQWLQNCSNPITEIERCLERGHTKIQQMWGLCLLHPRLTHGASDKNWFGALKLSLHWDSLVWRSWVNEKRSCCWNRKTVMRVPRDPT